MWVMTDLLTVVIGAMRHLSLRPCLFRYKAGYPQGIFDDLMLNRSLAVASSLLSLPSPRPPLQCRQERYITMAALGQRALMSQNPIESLSAPIPLPSKQTTLLYPWYEQTSRGRYTRRPFLAYRPGWSSRLAGEQTGKSIYISIYKFSIMFRRPT